jgi:chromate transporter
MQLATYAGWRLHGLKGGLMSGTLFVLPGALVVLALAMIYAAFGKVPFIESVFFGVKAAVLVIVVEALLRIAKKALKVPEHWLLAGLSFIAIFFFGAPFPLLIAAAALWGFLRFAAGDQKTTPLPRVPGTHTLRTVLVWGGLWAAPLVAIAAAFGRDHVLSQLGWFFSKLAVVTFGGAYAVLAYMGQDVVMKYGWLDAGAMMDGLGLAETTPGPLILVTEFVGYLAAHLHGGGPAMLMGILGAFVAVWATFVPCFLWIFAGAPYLEWITTQPRLKGALTAIMAAVVGVVLNLGVWFALHVFFANVKLFEVGILRVWTPRLASLDWRVVVLAALSGYLLLVRHWGIGSVLAISAALAMAIRYAGL